ncbi:MAG: hypothetical protein U0N08_06615 [Oscillospiraceae bacterium]|nr:hypothetical protein [Clostridiales bacterium]MDY2961512.1 hypothetical protein [Oscillospiraceae bacterium]MDD6108419.1 hypothetical protein [Clostridiales bacterium]MDD6936897.1 hypothetical protein [Clostridiales bacterium]MDY5595440.1 hypothetical protein [Oscillospiraceae bacterium]
MDDQNRYQSYPGGYDPYPPRNPQPGKSEATTSMILGIASLVCWFFGYTVIGSVILGIIGLVYASKAKQAGNQSGTRTAGFACSLIGLIGGCIAIVALIVLSAVFGAAFGSMFGILSAI